jgi:hypothetical protein
MTFGGRAFTIISMVDQNRLGAAIGFTLFCLGSPSYAPVAVATAQTAQAAISSSQNTAPMKNWSYDVVSVKPDKSGRDRLRIGMLDNEYSAENVRIINLVSQAYGIKQDLIVGIPGWAEGAHFDVTAKLSFEDGEAFSKLSREGRMPPTNSYCRAFCRKDSILVRMSKRGSSLSMT